MTTLPPHASNGNSSTYIIYALIDPRNCSTRYVGITNDMYRRYQEHINYRKGSTDKDLWMKELKENHYLPVMRTIEVIDTVRQARLREKYWISHYASMGEKLFNFECAEPEEVIYESLEVQPPPDLTTVRTAKVGRKFNSEMVKSIVMYYITNKSWPEGIDAEMCGYYERNYIRRSGKYYAKTREWRKSLLTK